MYSILGIFQEIIMGLARYVYYTTALYITITALAVAQLFAQVIFFLRLNVTKEGQWNSMPFVFTFLIVGVLVGGSLWIMYNLDVNMM